MSITNSITKLLNMEDTNLKFNEDFLEERKIKGKSKFELYQISSQSELILKGLLFNGEII